MVFKRLLNTGGVANGVKAKGVAKSAVMLAFVALTILTPTITYADNTTRHTYHFTNPNWQSMHHASNHTGANTWNWQHNWAYHAPQYQFQTTFPHDQWGRPTSSQFTPQLTQNVRRDRHSASLPPVHGTISGFYSGEFATNQVNPFAPRYNNNPAASHAVMVASPPFALLPGEAGVNVQVQGSHTGGFLASTSVQGGGGTMQGGLNESAGQSGFSVTHRPILPEPTSTPSTLSNPSNTQSTTQNNRITTVTPFDNGTIGIITIPTLNNRTAFVRPGVALSTLDHYVGHFSNTSQWDGRIALASHNRGQGSFFAGIWTLRYGDRIYYETTLGMRVYEVVSVQLISENDLSNLDHSHANTLVLVTCAAYQPHLRWSIVAVKVM